MEEDLVQDELVEALLEDMVRTQMEGIPSFLRTEKMDEQVREEKRAEAAQKGAELRARYGWLQVPVDFIVGLPLERAEELQEVVKTAWESFWQSLPEVAKSHLDAASAKAEWTKQEARKLVEATLAHAAPFRFRPEVEAMTSLERQLVAATTEAVAGKLGVALQRAVEQDMQKLPEYLRTKDVRESVQKNLYYKVLQSELALAGVTPAESVGEEQQEDLVPEEATAATSPKHKKQREDMVDPAVGAAVAVAEKLVTLGEAKENGKSVNAIAVKILRVPGAENVAKLRGGKEVRTFTILVADEEGRGNWREVGMYVF